MARKGKGKGCTKCRQCPSVDNARFIEQRHLARAVVC